MGADLLVFGVVTDADQQRVYCLECFNLLLFGRELGFLGLCGQARDFALKPAGPEDSALNETYVLDLVKPGFLEATL